MRGVAALALVLALLTLFQVRVWRSDEALWTRAVSVSPSLAKPWVNLAGVRMTQGRIAEADALLDRAQAVSATATDLDFVQANRAVIRIGQGRFSEAQALLRGAPFGTARWELCQRLTFCDATD